MAHLVTFVRNPDKIKSDSTFRHAVISVHCKILSIVAPTKMKVSGNSDRMNAVNASVTDEGYRQCIGPEIPGACTDVPMPVGDAIPFYQFRPPSKILCLDTSTN